MKVTVEKSSSSAQQINSSAPRDLSDKPRLPTRKPPRRRIRNSGTGVRLKREPGAPAAKRGSRPETPLPRWKFDEANARNDDDVGGEKDDEKLAGRNSRRRNRSVVSARKLAAGLWRLQLPESQPVQRTGNGHFGAPIHVDRVHSSPARDPIHSPQSVSGPKRGLLYKFEPPFQFSNTAMEGATKWDPFGSKTSDDWNQIFGQPKPRDHRASTAKAISALETELEQARTRINELKTDRRSSTKKLEQFLRKLSEERAAWRSREHEKIRVIIDDMKADLSREKKNRQRLEIINSKLVNELSDVKLSAKRYMQEYEKERKARELIEEVCDELAKEIGEDKAEVEALTRESMRLREDVEEERKMLQMAEVWREERVQMKLIDVKVMLEEKYSYMNRLVAELESFLKSENATSDNLEEMKKAELLCHVAGSVNMQDVRELTYEPPNADDIYSIFEDVNFGESNERGNEQCDGYSSTSHASSKMRTVSPEVKMLNKESAYRHSSVVYMDQSGELEEDASEWETVSHPGDQGSSFSPDARNGGEETPEISEVDSEQMRQIKRASAISKLWRSYPNNGDNFKIISVEGKNGRLSNGRLSNGAIMSPDGLSPQDLGGQWSSPESGNLHITRAMKGCIEWPRSAQKSSLKSRLLEARMESQKIQLRQVLKQKI